MKKNYMEPSVSLICLAEDDVLTASGDNDAPFISVGKGTLVDNGWSGYY